MVSNLLFLLIISFIQTQHLAFEKKTFFTTKGFEIDNLGMIYSIKDHNLNKYYADFTKKNSYTNYTLGLPDYIDVSNPLRILLFYKHGNQVLFLDNELEILGSPILLDDIQIFNPQLICSSELGGFWLFDNTYQKIIYINKDLQKKIETLSINLFTNQKNLPNYMAEIDRQIYLNIPQNNLLVFNRYGDYIKSLPITSSQIIRIENNKIYYIKDDSLEFYNLASNTTNTLISPVPVFDYIKIRNKKIYIFYADTLSIYKILN